MADIAMVCVSQLAQLERAAFWLEGRGGSESGWGGNGRGSLCLRMCDGRWSVAELGKKRKG